MFARLEALSGCNQEDFANHPCEQNHSNLVIETASHVNDVWACEELISSTA